VVEVPYPAVEPCRVEASYPVVVESYPVEGEAACRVVVEPYQAAEPCRVGLSFPVVVVEAVDLHWEEDSTCFEILERETSDEGGNALPCFSQWFYETCTCKYSSIIATTQQFSTVVVNEDKICQSEWFGEANEWSARRCDQSYTTHSCSMKAKA